MRGAATNPLASLFDKFCSDKGTIWGSRHHYASAYHTLLETRNVESMIEVGIGEDTAPSVVSWARYFPHARIFALEITRQFAFKQRAENGVTDRLVARQAQSGCDHDRGVWSDRVQLKLDTDATSAYELGRAQLPFGVDLIVDDGSHRMRDQEATLALLWPHLAAGGVYIIEDVFVGALPWDPLHARDAPTQNAHCKHECYYPQRIAEHPLLYDRFGVVGDAIASRPELLNSTRDVLGKNDWFWTVTGVHKGGGLDCTLIIRKAGVDFAHSRAVVERATPSASGALDTCAVEAGVALPVALLLVVFGLLAGTTCTMGWLRRRHDYRPVRSA